MIRIYVPSGSQQRRICYRSQLLNVLTTILSTGRAAAFDVSTIVSAKLEELDEVLAEQDIPPVSWIDRPVMVVQYDPEDERPVTPASSDATGDSETLVPHIGLATPGATPTRHGRAVPVVDVGFIAETTPPPQYPRLIEQVVRSAQRASHTHQYGRRMQSVERVQVYDHHATFGSRERNTFVHDRRIGAAGEGYVRSSPLLFVTC